MKKWTRLLLSVVVISTLLLSACSPKGEGVKIDKPVTVTLWHSWTDTNELALLDAVLAAYKEAYPKVTVETLAVPFDQLKNKYTTEASTGGGPDLLIGPKDWIGELTNAQLIAPLDEVAQTVLDDLNPAAVEANKFGGKVMALPESVEAVVLWYNKDMVANPPKTTDELLSMAATSGLALNTGFYHSVGFLFGFGGKIFDASQKCIFDQGGVADYLAFMAKAKASTGVLADADGGKLDAAFKDKQVGMIFNGPWATGDYSKALGADKLGIVAPISTPNGGKFSPFLGTKNLFLSANSEGDAQLAAIEFMRVMVSEEIQGKETVSAGHIPANGSVKVSDTIVAGIVTQTQTASYFPNEPEMGSVWGPAGDMITKVIEGKMEPAAAATEATTLINSANQK
ncbi:MAG: extracellular solute-binding protein [Chloroflexi bacterium]|nr:extracellular solute-binding protein [Chloroflexota bacterium]